VSLDDAYVLFVPAPCPFLTANGSRGNPAARNTLVQAWRAKAAWITRVAGLPRIDEHVQIVAWVNRGHNRGGRWDPTNWIDTAKACVDGIVQGGLLADDDSSRVTGPDMRAGSMRETPGLTILIRPHAPEKEPRS